MQDDTRDLMINIDNVTMEFNKSSEKVDSLKEYFTRLVQGRLHFTSFLALKDVSLQVYRGEIVGIIGLNGSGKSTLLKIVSGIMKPTKGKSEIFGQLSPLIELGAGFDIDLTGRENIYLNGSVLGYSKAFLDDLFDEIVEFAEIKEFLDVPIKNYSSGMQARLGFAIAAIVTPQILILDETLGVGDFKFRQKCENRINELLAADTTFLIVSHSLEQIERLCTRVMWLEQGKVKMIGDTKEVCEAYKST